MGNNVIKVNFKGPTPKLEELGTLVIAFSNGLMQDLAISGQDVSKTHKKLEEAYKEYSEEYLEIIRPSQPDMEFNGDVNDSYLSAISEYRLRKEAMSRIIPMFANNLEPRYTKREIE